MSPHMPYCPFGHVRAQLLLTLNLPAAQHGTARHSGAQHITLVCAINICCHCGNQEPPSAWCASVWCHIFLRYSSQQWCLLGLQPARKAAAATLLLQHWLSRQCGIPELRCDSPPQSNSREAWECHQPTRLLLQQGSSEALLRCRTSGGPHCPLFCTSSLTGW
jgi:hypothetical protein